MWHKEINCNQRASHHIHTALYTHHTPPYPHCIIHAHTTLPSHAFTPAVNTLFICCALPYQVILSIFPLAPSTETYSSGNCCKPVQVPISTCQGSQVTRLRLALNGFGDIWIRSNLLSQNKRDGCSFVIQYCHYQYQIICSLKFFCGVP